MALYRKYLLLTLAVIIPLGFGTKFYSGTMARWVNIYGGGVLYVIFWSIFIAFLFPRLRILYNVIAVFTVTCSLEFIQLWHPYFLEKFRSFFIGRALIGTTFSFLDIIHYSAGSFIVYVFLCCLNRRFNPSN